METIKYDEVNINVPTSWRDVKLKDYDKVFRLPTGTAAERVNYIATLCNTDAKLLLSWPAEVFDEVVRRMTFLFEEDKTAPSPNVTIRGVKFCVPVGDKLTLGEWVDAEEAQKQEHGVLPAMLAIVCRPVGEPYDCDLSDERAAMFAELPVSELLGVLAFFLRLRTELERITRTYSRISALVNHLPRSMWSFLKGGAGLKLSLIWRVPIFLILTGLLRYRVRRYSLF